LASKQAACFVFIAQLQLVSRLLAPSPWTMCYLRQFHGES
jgi:hypothetical protein